MRLKVLKLKIIIEHQNTSTQIEAHAVDVGFAICNLINKCIFTFILKIMKIQFKDPTWED